MTASSARCFNAHSVRPLRGLTTQASPSIRSDATPAPSRSPGGALAAPAQGTVESSAGCHEANNTPRLPREAEEGGAPVLFLRSLQPTPAMYGDDCILVRCWQCWEARCIADFDRSTAHAAGCAHV